MRRLLILSSAIVLTGCSVHDMGMGPYNGPSYHQSTGYSYGCGSGTCAPGNSYSVAENTPAYYDNAQPAYGYGTGQHPSADAYGTQVQNHQAHGHPPKLRGPYDPRARKSYKYGTLGAVWYDTDADIYGVQGRLGYQSAHYLGAEVEGSVGLTGESGTLGAATTELDVDYQVGAFAVARAPIGTRFSVFSRLGYAATRFSAEVDDGATVVEDSETFDGFAYGLGAEYAFDPRNSLRFDYTRYDMDPLDGATDSLALSYARKF